MLAASKARPDPISDTGNLRHRAVRCADDGDRLPAALRRSRMDLAASRRRGTASVGRVAVGQLSDRSRTWGDPLSYSILARSAGRSAVSSSRSSWCCSSSRQRRPFFAGYAIAQAAALLAVLLRIEKGAHPQRFSRELIAKAATYALPLVIGTVLIWVANNGIRFVVEWRDGAAAVGLVSVGWSIGLRIASVAAMVVTAAGFPLALARARSGGTSAGQDQLARNSLLLAAVLAPSAAGL